MNISIQPELGKFICQIEGGSKEFSFKEIRESEEWVKFKQIRLIHNTLNEYDIALESLLTRDAFVESLKRGDEEWVTRQQHHNLNLSIYKLYGLIEGKEEAEIEGEISNLMQQARKLYSRIKEWNHDRSTKINLLEEALDTSSSEQEKAKILKKIGKLRTESKPFKVADEIKKMVIAARDKSKPEITLANVTPELVEQEYGKDFKVV